MPVGWLERAAPFVAVWALGGGAMVVADTAFLLWVEVRETLWGKYSTERGGCRIVRGRAIFIGEGHV